MKTAITLVGLSVPFFILTVWAVVNAAMKDFGTPGKIVFWLIVASIPYIGFVFYFAIGFRKGKKPVDLTPPFR